VDVQTRSRTEAGLTLVVLLGLACAALPPLRAPALTAGFLALEVVGMVVGSSTLLLMGVYGALLLLGPVVDRVGADASGGVRVVGWVVSSLALLGLGYTLVFAAFVDPALLVATTCAAGAGWWVGRRGAADGLEAGPPVITLFLAIHLLVEGTAAHLTTRWTHGVSAWMASMAAAPLPWGLLVGGLGCAVVLLAGGLRWRGVAGAVGAVVGLSVALAPAGGAAVAAVAVGLGVGLVTGRAGRRLIDLAHPDPTRLVGRLAPLGLVALAVTGAHYVGTMWRCGPPGAGLERLSDRAGAFSLETTADGAYLVASLREEQQLLILDRASGEQRTVSLASDEDRLFDRAEPETLLGLADGRVLVLVAASDGESGNRLRLLDPGSATLTPPLPSVGPGVSDVVGDGAGGVWLSTEFEGVIARIEPASGALVTSFDVPDAETNKILVDAPTRRAWSAGLWWDDQLRLIDTGTGAELASARVGTHQWDLGRLGEELYLPKFLAGRVEVRDAGSLELLRSWPAGFGVRPLAAWDDLVVTGGLYGGDVSGWDPATGAARFRHHVGGHVKAVAANEHGVFAAGNCGIFAVRRP